MMVLWRVTEACNLACGFCAYDRRLKRPRAATDPSEVARGLALFEAWGKARGAPIHISFLGGEPLLWRPLFDLVARPATHLRFSATTNGTTLADAGVRDFLCAHFSELTVSIDALADTHDRLRGREGLWATLRTSIGLLAAARNAEALKLRVNTVLMQSTVREFSALCLALADWGIDEITFNALGGRDRPEFFPGERLWPKDWSSFCASLDDLRGALHAKGVRLVASPAYLDRISASALGETRTVDDCGPGEAHLFLDCDGAVSPCHFTSADYGVRLSDLRSVDDLDRLPQMFRIARCASPSPHCSDCLSTRVFGKFAA